MTLSVLLCTAHRAMAAEGVLGLPDVLVPVTLGDLIPLPCWFLDCDLSGTCRNGNGILQTSHGGTLPHLKLEIGMWRSRVRQTPSHVAEEIEW